MKTPAWTWAVLCLIISVTLTHANSGMINFSGSNLSSKKVLAQVFSAIMQNGAALNISIPCQRQLFSPKVMALWMQYADALGKPGSSILTGNVYWPGSLDECEAIPDSRYCLSTLSVNMTALGMGKPTSAMLGICTPSACNENDITWAFNYGMKVINMSNILSIPKAGTIPQLGGIVMICQKETRYSSGAKGTLALCGVLLFLCFVGTITEVLKDIFSHPNKALNKSKNFMPTKGTGGEEDPSSDSEELDDSDSKPLIAFNDTRKKSVGQHIVDVLMCFSLIRNTKVVLNTDVPKGAVTSLNGIRVFSMWWVILGHVESMTMYAGLDNLLTAFTVLKRFTFLPVVNGVFSVDSFFFLSGLLVAYLSMRRFEARGSLPLLQFYVHRFLRLTPVYLFVILFFTYIFPLIGKGTYWPMVAEGAPIQACKDYWWTNILYINNFYPVNMANTCIGWTWYLANDMQFYIISPIFIYAMYKWRIPGGAITIGIALVGSFIATGSLIGYYDLSPFTAEDLTNLNAQHKQNEYMKYVYVTPYCRIAPYLVGMITGYILHKQIKLRGQLKWVYAVIGWAIAVAFGMMLTYGTWPYYKTGGTLPSRGVNIMYGTFSRFIWGCALAWVAYACHFGFGGLINKFLSWKAFTPLSRLTYGVYMIHIIVIEVFFLSRTTPFHYTDMQIAIYFMATVVTSYAGAFVLSVCLEMPAAHLEKLVFKF